MNKTLVSIIVGAVLVAAIGGFVAWQKNAVPEQSAVVPDTNQGTDASVTPVAQPSGITSADVAKHNSRASCWATINGNVYDLTSWIPQHPGGEQAILQLCGTDGSAKFNRQHGGAPQQAAILAGFKIGVATQ